MSLDKGTRDETRTLVNGTKISLDRNHMSLDSRQRARKHLKSLSITSSGFALSEFRILIEMYFRKGLSQAFIYLVVYLFSVHR